MYVENYFSELFLKILFICLLNLLSVLYSVLRALVFDNMVLLPLQKLSSKNCLFFFFSEVNRLMWMCLTFFYLFSRNMVQRKCELRTISSKYFFFFEFKKAFLCVLNLIQYYRWNVLETGEQQLTAVWGLTLIGSVSQMKAFHYKPLLKVMLYERY